MNRQDDFAVVVGCGRLGSHIANQLSKEGWSVVLIDKKERSFDNISSEFSGFTVLADATEHEVLLQAKIDQANLLVASTNDDNTNVFIAQIAKKIFHVPKVIARIFEPSRARLYEGLDIVTFSPTLLSVEKINSLLCIGEEE